MIESLQKGTSNIEEINRRLKNCILISQNNSNKVLSGEEAQRYLQKNTTQEDIKHTNEIKGMCASPGSARGIVKLIFSPRDIEKMNEGDILVAHATNPDIIPAMKKAAAIITNTGGITCHAAIVARELNIPCVIGTKIATEILKDGDLVEVDASCGIVKKIE